MRNPVAFLLSPEGAALQRTVERPCGVLARWCGRPGRVAGVAAMSAGVAWRMSLGATEERAVAREIAYRVALALRPDTTGFRRCWPLQEPLGL